jgi:hypothetical protein
LQLQLLLNDFDISYFVDPSNPRRFWSSSRIFDKVGFPEENYRPAHDILNLFLVSFEVWLQFSHKISGYLFNYSTLKSILKHKRIQLDDDLEPISLPDWLYSALSKAFEAIRSLDAVVHDESESQKASFKKRKSNPEQTAEQSLKLPKTSNSTTNSKCFIRNLSWNTTESMVSDALAFCGTIIEVHIFRHQFTGKSKGFGSITFSNHHFAQTAINKSGKVLIDKRCIQIMQFISKR